MELAIRAMKRRTKGVLLVGGLAAATVVGLAVALARLPDPQHYCDTGFSRLAGCTAQRSSTTTGRGSPFFAGPASLASAPAPESHQPFQLISVDTTLWAVALCPRNAVGRRLLCGSTAAASPVETADHDLASRLPLPKPWFVRTAKNSPFIEAVHVETPLDLAAVRDFYRGELRKRGWTETGGATLAPDRAAIAFTTADGPALLRLVRQDDRTIADLSLRKSTDATSTIRPAPGQAQLLLGNTTNEAAEITIDARTTRLAAHTGRTLTDEPKAGKPSPDRAEMTLPPGKYTATFRIASGTAHAHAFEVAADETWALLVGPAGVPLPVRLY